MDADVLAFLRRQLPDHAGTTLAEAFGQIYEEGRYSRSLPKPMWKAEIEKLRATADEMRRPNQGDDWEALYNALPKNAKLQLEGLRRSPAGEAADALENYAAVSELWYKRNPMSGGREPEAYALAGAIEELFSELGENVTVGADDDGEPTGRFGKVVQHAINHHRLQAHWRRAAEAAKAAGEARKQSR